MDSPVGTDIFGGRILTGDGSYPTDFVVDGVGAEGLSYNPDPQGFEDYHTGDTLVGSLFSGLGIGGIPTKDSSNDSVLVALQFIYKF